MSSARDDFLAQFDPSITPYIVEFGDRLSNIETDVIITMARKATCLVDCLELLKLATLQTPTTSDRVLDMDPEWLRNKNVVIVDDALISGKTLYRTRRTLERAGVASLSIALLCVDTKWWNPELAQPAPPYLELSDRNAVSFCASIVDAISVVPIPYAVDYPLFKGMRVPVTDIAAVTASPRWFATEVSSPLQLEHGVFSITATPTSRALSDLDESLGWPLSANSLAKVRVYGRRILSGRQFYLCHVLPVIAFNPIKTNELEQLWTSMRSRSGAPNSELWDAFTSGTSRLRLIQYVVAARLAQVWLGDVQDSMASTAFARQDPRMLANLFPPHTVDAIRDLADSKTPLFEDGPAVLTHVSKPGQHAVSQRRTRERDPWMLMSQLTEPFLKLRSDQEEAARVRQKLYGPSAIEEDLVAATIDRLQTGYSIPQLNDIATESHGAIGREFVSAFLDLAIDRGIVVPLTAEVGGAVFRAYRHGEDVEFAEAEERLCALMLDAVGKETGREALPRLWVEKLIVLLLRIGVQRQFLTPWYGQLGEPRTASIIYSLHGAVVSQGAKTLYDYNPEGGVTRTLLDHHVLANDAAKRYKVNRIPNWPTRAKADPQAIQLGLVFGKALSANDDQQRPLLDFADLTLISTCMSHNDIAGALAAEIMVFVTQWGRRFRSFEASLNEPSDYARLAAELRESLLFKAVNSAEWKYGAFKSGETRHIIERVSKSFADPLYRETWNSFWPLSDTQDDVAAGGIASLVLREGMWCLEVSVAARMLEYALRSGGISDSKKLAPLLDEICGLRQRLARAARESGVPLHLSAIEGFEQKSLDKTLDYDGLRAYACEQLRRLRAEGQALLAEVDGSVTWFGRARPIVRFDHAFHVMVTPLSSADSLRRDAEKIVQSFRIRAKKEREATLELVPSGQGTVPRGFWVCARGRFARAWLLRLAVALIGELGTRGVVRCTLFASLPSWACLVKSSKDSMFRSPVFWRLAADIIGRDVRTRAEHSALVVVSESDRPLMERIKGEVRSEHPDLFLLPKTTSFAPSAEFPSALASIAFKVRPKASPLTARQHEWKFDVGILTIVSEETKAVMRALKRRPNYRERPGDLTERMFYEGTLPDSGGARYRVVATQALEQGNRSVMAAYYDMVAEFGPALVVLLGIGGSIHKDIGLCDVVVADEAIYYDRRSETEDGPKVRARIFDMEPWLKVAMNHFFVSEEPDTAAFEAADGSLAPTFRFAMGPVGTGEAVVRFRNADVRKRLMDINDKAMVLETEAGGMAQAFYEERLQRGDRSRGSLVLRGVSDHADHLKDDKWRQPSASNAMLVLERFLASVERSLIGTRR